MPAVFAQGSSGKTIERFQRVLTKYMVPMSGGGTEPALREDQVDGQFGSTLRKAIVRVQKKEGVAQTGTIDRSLWEAIPNAGDWPSEYEISLGLVGSFEGHSYTKAAGNYDSAGITWGIIGFTLICWKDKKKTVPAYGSLHSLLKKIKVEVPGSFDKAFGTVQAQILENLIEGTPADLYKFAVAISTPNKSALLASWQAGFKALGQLAAVQKLQDDLAQTMYYKPALAAAEEFANAYGMASPRTRQLFFDIEVNNGGLTANEKALANAALVKLLEDNHKASLEAKLLAISEVLATSRNKEFEKDIRARKRTISNGSGEVHKKLYDLDKWGIDRDDSPKADLDLRLMLLNFTDQIGEQRLLAEAAMAVTGREYAAELGLAARWPEGNGTALLPTRNGLTLSLRGLFEPANMSLIQPEGDSLRHALGLMFTKPVGILALMGQAAPEEIPGHGLIFGRQGGTSVGLSIGGEAEFSLVRQKLLHEGAELCVLDVPEATRSLANCQLVMLYSGYGVSKNPAARSPARLWRERLRSVGAKPIVLGWRGNTRTPRDAARQFVSERFFVALRAMDPSATLEELCVANPEKVIQSWGKACWDAFHDGPQRFLWHDTGIAALEFTQAGAAAMDADGRVWIANSKFDGAIGLPMEAV